MKRFLSFNLLAVVCVFGVTHFFATPQAAHAQTVADSTNVRRVPLSADETARIVREFSAKETVFRTALNNYAFKREAIVQTIGMGGQISGEFRRDSLFVFDDKSRRFERVVHAPAPTLTEIGITNEDLEDLGGVQPFALEASKISFYNFAYLGKEKIDELDLYVFDVTPKSLPDPKKSKERFFQGRVWVDDKDLQIVKARGKGVPEGKQRFPIFETYREQIDGRYWFPTYTFADDTLVFEGGQSVRIRTRVRYMDYKKPRVKVEVLPDEGDDEPPTEP